MQFVYRNPECEAALAAADSYDALEAAMRALRALVPGFADPEIRGRQMFWPALDALVPTVARRLGLKDAPLAGPAKGNDNVCILATGFYATGGHSKVAADITRLIGAERTTIVLTDADGRLSWRRVINTSPVDALYHRRSTLILTAPTLPEKIVELYMTLAAIRPSRIFLMANHMDVVATVAAWPFRDVVEFVHHADHMPVLGATLPFSGHADLTYTCHLACQAAGTGPVYAGMTIESRKRQPTPPAGAPRRIATCGSLQKYRYAARYRWSDFVVAALRASDADFIHIGDWQEDFGAEMRGALLAAGLDPDRYRPVGPRPDLRDVLAAEAVDAYVASYPDSGGRAILEAMDAGLVPIVPVAEEQGDLLKFDLPLRTWIRVTEPGQMSEALGEAATRRSALTTAEGRAVLAREFARFETYVREGIDAVEPAAP